MKEKSASYVKWTPTNIPCQNAEARWWLIGHRRAKAFWRNWNEVTFDSNLGFSPPQQHFRHKSIFVVWIYRQLFIFGFHNKYQLSLQIHLEVFTKKLLNLKFNQSEQNGGKKVLTFHIYNFSHHQRPKVLYKWKV